MHAFLIKSSNTNSALKLIKQKLKIKNTDNHPDVLIIDQPNSISIKAIRNLKNWTANKPFQSQAKAALIHNAHLMTPPAQNALLKTLEEPPQNTYLVLTTPNPQLLLETIISRCHLITIKSQPASQSTRTVPVGSRNDKARPCHDMLNKLAKATPGERIALAANHSSNRDNAIEFCESLLPLARTTHHHALKHTTQALKRLKNNVNPRLTIESLFLNF